MNRELRALVLDDDENRVARVMDVMPDYINAMASRFNKDAQKLIVRDDGTRMDLVIMYADDLRAISLYIFDWMKKDSDHLGLRRIPVIIYTDDAYSDRVMEFLEIDDVFIHEGEIDDHNFYSVISEAVESIESYEDDFYDASVPGGHIEPEAIEADTGSDEIDDEIERLVKNNPERLMGITISAPTGANSENRSMLINDSDKLKSVIEAIKESKEKSYQLRLILQETAEDKLQREQMAKNYYTQELSNNDSNSIVQQSLDRIRSEKDSDTQYVHGHTLETDEDGKLRIGSVSSNFTAPLSDTFAADRQDVPSSNEARIIDTNRYNTQLPDDSNESQGKSGHLFTKKGGKVSLANIYSQHNRAGKAEEPAASAKKKLLVVDVDPMTKLSLQYHYSNVLEVDFADSSMKAIDYFIQHKPDIVLVEYDMPFVNGIMILDSIRRQPNGANVKAVVLLDVTKHSELISVISSRPDITGVIYKPFVKEQFVATMQRCLM